MSWKTWSPFQSASTREICDHMTLAEKSAVTTRGMGYGVWTAISAAIPISLVVMKPTTLTLSLALPLVAAHLFFIPIWQRKQREFLCQTTWAKSKGIRPEDLRLFGLRRNDG